MILSKRLRQARKKKGLTQIKVAELIFMDRRTLYLFETNRRVPRVEMIERLAKIYDVNPAWLVGWSEDRERKSIREQD